MTIILTILLTLLTVVPAWALDKKIVATNCVKIGIFDTDGNGIAGLDVVTPFADFAGKIQCGAQTLVTMDETGDTVVDEGGGYYYICTNDTIGNANEEECLAWVEGEGNYTGLIAKSPVKFKAVGATVDVLANIETDTQNIQGRIPTALVGGKMDSFGSLLKQISVSAGTTASAIISTGGFTESSNRGYVGGIVNCPAATATENRPVFLKIISFNPTTDTVTLNGSFPTVLTIGDVCNIYIDTIR